MASTYSVYSCVSNRKSPHVGRPEVASIDAQSSPQINQVNDVREKFIEVSVLRLTEVKEALATEQRAVEELLQVAKLLVDKESVI